MTLIDLSHPIEDGQRVYAHLPAAKIREHMSREQSRPQYTGGTTFHIGKAELVGNLGTWVDAPFHRHADAPDLAELPLEKLAHLEVTVLPAGCEPRAIDAAAFDGIRIRDRAVLVHTGWSAHWQTPRYVEAFPFLTARAARRLADEGARLVGIDSLNVDDPADGTRPAHTILLARGIPIAENLTNLAALPADRAIRLHAAPVKLRAMGSFPVRAYAVVEDQR